MQIDTKLNLVLPVCWREVETPHPTDKDRTIIRLEATAWAHHTPISSNVFEANYRIIVGAMNEVDEGGKAGPAMAALSLRNAARIDARKQGLDDDKAATALLNEIRRQTSIIAPSEGGYIPLMADIAISQGVLSKSEWGEAESRIVFFTCYFSVAQLARRSRLAESLASVLQGSITSSTPTEYAGSLRTSTASATSAAPEPSSETSSTG